jgi:DNA ligase 1
VRFEEVAKCYEKLEGISSRLEMIDTLTEMFKKTHKDEIKNLIYFTQGVLGPAYVGIETGIAEKFAEQAIAVATGFEREQVLAGYKKSGDLGLTAEEFIKKTKLRKMVSKRFDVNDVFEAMTKIAHTFGSGSQEVKIKMLVNLLSFSSPLESRYLIRFALGKLRLGAGDATILEALSKSSTGERKFKEELENAYNICSDLGKVGEVLVKEGETGIKHMKVSLFNPIRPALAERLPSAEEILEKMHGKCAVESKYDGLRAQVHIDKKAKKVEIFSRNLERLTDMFPDIVKAALAEVKAERVILEGEAIAYNDATGEFRPFQETIQRKRKHDIGEKSLTMPLHLFAFDLLFIDGEDYLEKPYEERRKKLESILTKDGRILPSDMKIVTTPKQLDKYFEEMVGDGLEGIVAKELHARYIAGARKFSWIKLKRSYRGELSDSVDLVIIGYFLGRGQRAEFQFGGLLTAVYNEKRDIYESITKIGTGFSEEQMKMFKTTLDKIKVAHKPARVESLITPDFWVDPKYVIEVRADEITRSPLHVAGKPEGTDEPGYALRFPRIISDGIRADKSADEATTTKEIVEMFNQQKKVKVDDR